MDNYVINSIASKSDFVREGFTNCGDNTLQLVRDLYKGMISLKVSIEFSDQDPWINTKVYITKSGETYPLCCEYGINQVRDTVMSRYKEEMNKLIRLGLIRRAN